MQTDQFYPYTTVSGKALVLMGLVGTAAGVVAGIQPDLRSWLFVWLVGAPIGFAIGVLGLFLKSTKAGIPFLQHPLRRFAFSLAPALAAATLLTIVLSRCGDTRLFPGVWLLLYGVGIVAGGIHALRLIPLMGLCFMALGHLVFASPPEWGDGYMLAGFGGLHVVFGAIIWRKHGG